MILKDADSAWSFEMRVVGYQCDDPENVSDMDSRWLRQQFRVAYQDQSWKWIGASLFFEEIPQLIRWLRAAANREDVKPHIDFIEPDIRFELSAANGDQTTIKVCLAKDWGYPAPGAYLKGSFKELTEHWKASTHTQYGVDEVCREFTVNTYDLLLSADSLVHDLHQLPPRTETERFSPGE